MTPQSLFAILIFLASCVSTFSDIVPSNILFQNQVYQNENLTVNTRQVTEKYNNSGELYGEPIRGSIKQSEEQMFTYLVNTSTGVGENYVPLVFLTGNICSEPNDLNPSANNSLVVYFSFNESAMYDLEESYMYDFEFGYFSALTQVDIEQGDEQILHVLVRAPQSTNLNDTWTYEIGVSQNDLTHQWDQNPYVELTAADSSSVLLTTKNLTMKEGDDLDNYNVSESGYDLLIFNHDYKDHMASLNNSWCAIKHGPVLFSASEFATSYTLRCGGLHQQFHIEGLNASTKYLGVLIQERHKDKAGGVVYSSFEFETQGGEACALIYNLEFCDQVAYSVPASSFEGLSDSRQLKKVYDDRARSLYANFSKSLEQVVCNTTKDAVFSPLRTCEDCSTSYKNWLCAVTIPRCTTRNATGYVLRSKDEARSSFIDEYIKPPLDYYEILPCLNVCQIMVRDCPAEFGFTCPSTNATIVRSYYWDEGDHYAACNFVGSMFEETSASQIIHVTWSVLIFGVSAAMFL